MLARIGRPDAIAVVPSPVGAFTLDQAGEDRREPTPGRIPRPTRLDEGEVDAREHVLGPHVPVAVDVTAAERLDQGDVLDVHLTAALAFRWAQRFREVALSPAAPLRCCWLRFQELQLQPSRAHCSDCTAARLC